MLYGLGGNVRKQLIAVAVCLMLLAGCGGGAAATKETVTVQVPTTVFVTGDAGAVASSSASVPSAETVPPVGSSVPFTWSRSGEGIATVNTAEWTTEAPNQFSGPPKNGAYLVLDVTVEATEGTISANPLYWQAKDVEGHTYDYAFTSVKDPGLATGELPAGEKSRGFVAIDSPQLAVTVQLVNPGQQVVASWAVDG